ncbi:MAG: NYN domain-containing protein, partial [Chloroflexi bacterium]|nr:NYN domain-containing protein [Chloroflexota bacterium]
MPINRLGVTVGKNVAVFVDVANIFYAAKAAGVDIDYVTLLKAATAGRDFVRAYAYTGLDPENENQRNFHSFLTRHGYRVVSKDIRKYGDGKVKANLDIELVVDLMKTARNLDVAIIISGDGDFAPAIRAVQEMGVRVEVISFRGNTSSDLIEAADLFSDITQLAKVERSGRSGRRVADDEFDVSMTEVPDKQTEGAGGGRLSRGRGRGRGRVAETDAREVVTAGRSDARGGDRNGPGAGPITVLPGEKLSRVRRGLAAAAGTVEAAAAFEDQGEPAEAVPSPMAGEGVGEGVEGEMRRRRRRGGRGRGRGRGRAEDGSPMGGEAPREPQEQREPVERARLPYEDEEPVPGPRGQRPTPFGSIWDSQLGVPTARPAAAADIEPLPDDKEEPEIPEYLLAERRRGRGGQQGGRGQMGGRGRGAGYAAALDRERFGGGRGMPAGTSRYAEPL